MGSDLPLYFSMTKEPDEEAKRVWGEIAEAASKRAKKVANKKKKRREEIELEGEMHFRVVGYWLLTLCYEYRKEKKVALWLKHSICFQFE